MIDFICKVTLCFTPYFLLLAFAPYPLFQWYPQSNEILLNLGIKCWNSAFNPQGSRVTIVIVQVGALKIYVTAAVEALRKNERQDETQFTTKIGGNTSLGSQLFSFCRISIPSYAFDALLLCRNWLFSPPTRLTFYG